MEGALKANKKKTQTHPYNSRANPSAAASDESLFHGGLTVQMSSQSSDDMILRRKIAKLENAREIERVERMVRDLQATLEKKELEQKMKDLEQKMERMHAKAQATLEKKDLEQKMEKRDLEQKMERMQVQAQAALEKKDLEQKMERIQAQVEKKDLEQKVEKWRRRTWSRRWNECRRRQR
jgi:hypothetical protein